MNKQITKTMEKLDLIDQNAKNFVVRTGAPSPTKGLSLSPSKLSHTLSQTKFIFAAQSASKLPAEL